MNNMNILLVYATNSGGTQLASQIVQEHLMSQNLQVTMKEVRDTQPEELTDADAVILASSTWDYEGLEGQPHPDYRPFMELFKGKKITGKKFAVLGLGDSSYTYFCGAVNHLEQFVKDLEGILTDFISTSRLIQKNWLPGRIIWEKLSSSNSCHPSKDIYSV